MRCKGRTLAGKRCSHQASYGNFCGHHRGQARKKKKPANGRRKPAKKTTKRRASKTPTMKSKGGVPYGALLKGARYYFSHERGSHKYWAAAVYGKEYCAHWGRIGYGGSSGCKTFSSPSAAKAYLASEKRKKVNKGYRAGAASGVFNPRYSLKRKNPCGHRWKMKRNP